VSQIRWVVAAAVLDDLRRPRRLLAARRTEPAWAAGQWELPGGGVEAGEDHVSALHRELVEELGISVEGGAEVAGPDGEAGWAIRPGYRMRVWPAVVVDGDPAPIEDHDAVVWLPPERWLDIGWLPSNRPIVEALQRMREGRP
jgi:8-oxo-dGTP diphosphatase